MYNGAMAVKSSPKSSSASKRLHVWWDGRVQGVGFRYTAETAAQALKLRGWVRNLPDGRVEAVCEGAEDRLTQFLEAIKTGPMAPHIRRVRAQWEDPTREFRDFQIRFL